MDYEAHDDNGDDENHSNGVSDVDIYDDGSHRDEGSEGLEYRSLSDRILNAIGRPRSGRRSTIQETNSDYRGFNTSITDMFADPEQERIDCCALVCCGCLQADRDRYLATGVKPPTCWRRFCSHIVTPFVIFAMAIYVAVSVPDAWLNQTLCYGFVILFVIYFISQCFKGAWKRRNSRKNILFSKYYKRDPVHAPGIVHDGESDDENDEHEVASGSLDYLQGQTRFDLWNAHTIVGCYATDRPVMSTMEQEESEEKATFCTKLFQCLSSACCGKICGMHLQLCGFCAVAQEGRQLEAMIRPGKRRIDYITMQPMMEYYPAIYEARHTTTPLSWWYQRLSSFSRWALFNSCAVLLFLFFWSLLAFKRNVRYGPMNFLVLFFAIVQSLALIVLVYWRHRKDISIDALIKFFAAGFCLSSSLAVFFEILFGIVIRITMSLLMALSGVDVVEAQGYQLGEPRIGSVWTSAQEVNYGGSDYRAYLEVYGNDHPMIYTVYLFVASFFLAALVEELCKYFGYRMVDHPDFHSKSEVEDAMECHEDDREELRAPSFADQDSSHQSKAAAITVCMVTVAVGFACCENLIYIFIYGGSNASTQASILLTRSCIPVHPIAAALQSVRVVQRDIEKDRKVRLGRILLPGILFHGFYDFLVLWINYLGSRQGVFVDEDDSVNLSTENGSQKAATIASVFVCLSAIIYYVREARRQRRRLKTLDGETIDATDFGGAFERPFSIT